MEKCLRPTSTAIVVTLLVVLGALAVPAAATSQSTPGFDGLNLIGASPAAQPAPAARATCPARPFVIGRDNLAFRNPAGAMAMAQMSGCCYTMAVVARLFYERAHYRPEVPSGAAPGFRSTDLAAALRSGPAASFDVPGYDSLFSLTSTPGVADDAVEGWLEGTVRHRMGLVAEAPEPRDLANVASLVDIYRTIATIHYLHYFQKQGGVFVEAMSRHAMTGPASLRRVNLATVDQVAAELGRGTLPILGMFNPTPAIAYGHVVLAYKLQDAPGAACADLYVYDNNLQFGAVRDESILRVDRATGRFSLMRKLAATGEVVPDGTYDGANWYADPSGCNLLVLPFLYELPANRTELAARLGLSAESTGSLLAVGDYLRTTTQRSPAESSLFRDTADLVRALEAVQERVGNAPLAPGGRLGQGATVADLNRHLAAHTDLALRAVYPYAMPAGLSIRDTSVRFSPDDPNRATLQTTLVLEPGASFDDVAAALERSAAFAGRDGLAAGVRRLASAFEGERLSLTARVDLVKGPCSVTRVGPYAPMPTLVASHAVVGDLTPSTDVPRDRHVIEVSERILQRLAAEALRAASLLGSPNTFDYSFRVAVPVPLTGREVGRTFERVGSVTLDGLAPECEPGALVLAGAAHGFAPVMTASRGVNFSTARTACSLSVRVRPRNVLELEGAFQGRLSVDAGLTSAGDAMLMSALSACANRLLPRLSPLFAALLRDHAGRALSLAEGAAVTFSGIRTTRTTVSFRLDPVAVDLGATLRRLLGQDVPASLEDLRVTGDRVILVASTAPPAA